MVRGRAAVSSDLMVRIWVPIGIGRFPFDGWHFRVPIKTFQQIRFLLYWFRPLVWWFLSTWLVASYHNKSNISIYHFQARTLPIKYLWVWWVSVGMCHGKLMVSCRFCFSVSAKYEKPTIGESPMVGMPFLLDWNLIGFILQLLIRAVVVHKYFNNFFKIFQVHFLGICYRLGSLIFH